MIKKILKGEYLTGIGGMTAEERTAYEARVGEWLRTDGARLMAMTERPMAMSQNIVLLGARWTAEDCRAFHEGVVLLSALEEVTETWLPTLLYHKSAHRAVRKVVESLMAINQDKQNDKPSGELGHADSAEVRRKAGAQAAGKDMSHGNDGNNGNVRFAERNISAVSAVSAGQKTAIPATESQGASGGERGASGGMQGLVPARPKHIDQYVHLLPEATQKRAAMVQGMLRDMDFAREQARLLMNDAHASADSRATWMRRVVDLDKQVKGIYAELDREWEKVAQSGRVVVDALGNARVVEPSPQNGETQDTGGTAQGGDTQGERLLTSEQKHRRRELRKWLIDLRRGGEGKAREKRIEQWRVNWQEYLTLEPLTLALKDEKIVTAAAHFGIEINGAH